MSVTSEEVQRRLGEVLDRFEALANRLDLTYVRRETFDSYKELMTARLDAARTEKEALAQQVKSEKEALEARVKVLEEDRTAKNRLVWGALVSGVGSLAVALVLLVVKGYGG